MKIYVKLFDGQTMPEFINKGRWVDLRANADATIKSPCIEKVISKDGSERLVCKIENTMIPLGIAMQAPKGFECLVVPRSSTYKKTKTILANSIGIIDGVTYKGSVGYNGDNDQWWYNAVALNTCHIKKGDRIAQFRIMLSQDATLWQKLRWLFSGKIELVQVDHLESKDRGGFGSTDKKEEK